VKPQKHHHPKIQPLPTLYNSFYPDRPSSFWFDNPWSHVVLILGFVAILLVLIFVIGGKP